MENQGQRLGVNKARLVLGYAVRAVLLIFAIISINFVLVHLMPGDPIIHILGDEQYFRLYNQFPERLEEVRKVYSLDGSLFEQYIKYLYQVVTLQFGHSFIGGVSVVTTVLFRMKWTVILAMCSIVISALVGGSLGVIAGYHKGGKFDFVLTAILLFVETIPANCIALIALVIFSYKLRWFAVGGMVSGGLTGLARLVSTLHHMALPVLVLSLFRTSSNFLLMKSYVSQICDEDYITVAIAKGISKTHVLFRHLLRNALVPFITTICLQIGHILSGAMLIEVVFSWKGMGTLIYDAVNSRDYPTVQMCLLLIAICVVVCNFIADMLCMYIDPRIRDGIKNG
jgi:peptide/nickel transport system permease protein